jgi:hypothetical protein
VQSEALVARLRMVAGAHLGVFIGVHPNVPVAACPGMVEAVGSDIHSALQSNTFSSMRLYGCAVAVSVSRSKVMLVQSNMFPPVSWSMLGAMLSTAPIVE